MHHIYSPRTCDASIEEEIVAKGLTAPRITPADIESNIEAAYYFTAQEGDAGHVTAQVRAAAPEKQLTISPLSENPQPVRGPLDLLTFCVLVLRNGFTVTGESACASPENFDAEVGRKIARANAVQKIWPLMGYELKSKLSA